MGIVRELGAWLVPLALLAITAALAWLWLVGRPKVALVLLLVGLPLHTVVFQVGSVYLPAWLVSGLRLWREALLLALGVALVRQWASARVRIKRHWLIGIALLLYGATLLMGVWRGENLRLALSALRLAVMPLGLFVICLYLPYDLISLQKVVPWILGVGAVVALFALYQGYVLGPQFLWDYYATNGRLPHAYEVGGSPAQRLMGTFSSPNQLALYLVFLAMVAASLFMVGQKSRWAYLGLGVLYLLVLALTVSRSGWAGVAVGGVVLLLLWWHGWELWAALAGLAGLGLVAMAQRGLLARLGHLLSLQEVSAAYHVAMGWENLQTIARTPLGAGLGSAGALCEAAGLTQTCYATESFWLQIGLQQGVPGMLAFGLLVCVAAVGLVRSLRSTATPFGRALTLAALASLAGAMVHAIMNVDLQDMGVQSYLWFLVAMGLRLPELEAAERREAGDAA